MILIGMISGTSADGIEVAVVEINGAPPAFSWQLVKHLHVDHPGNLRDEIVKCFRPEYGTVDRLCALNFHIGQAFADAALQAIDAAGLKPSQVDLIGSHGQTLWHIPFGADASTLQFGEPAVIAERTGITTISNFRTRDMAAGGQAAPLVPLLDVLLLSHPTLTRGALNIGGIGNVTYLPPTHPERSEAESKDAFAFDTGPGNMLIDYAASRATNGEWKYDRDGVLAAQGRIDKTLLDELMQEPFLKLQPPKTTGRELFGAQYGAPVWERAKNRGLSDNDIIATLTAFTAQSIAQAISAFLPTRIDELIVSGGGAENPTLVNMLSEAVAPARVIRSDDFGLPTEAKEAIAFAVLAYETYFNRAGNVPAATGARHPVILGNITPGKSPISILESPNLTEARNPATENIDAFSSLDIVRAMNEEDAFVARAVSAELKNIAHAIDQIAERMQRGGRLIYIGAGTSGRLGVLDAAECPPTFSASPNQVIGLIAGGARAITQAVEGAEDDPDSGARDIASLNVSAIDSVVGIAASGRTPYVIGGMQEAKKRGAFVASIACNRPSPIEEIAHIGIALLVGPEIVSGSTRLKAGTAQKMVLNMLSTGVMIRLGKTFGNLMVDVQATNKKLHERARRIVATACDISVNDADELLSLCNGQVKTAIVSRLAHVTADQARKRLADAKGSVRLALKTADR